MHHRRPTTAAGNGDTYTGGVITKGATEVMHGEGEYTYSGPDWAEGGADRPLKYTGTWHEGTRHGHGTMQYAGGTVYEGPWVQDVRTGHDAHLFAGDATWDYRGDFANDRPHGRGVYTHTATNSTYDGEWRDGVRSGTGRYSTPDVAFEGVWLNDRPVRGKLRCSRPPIIYEGVVDPTTGMPSGVGQCMYKHGTTEVWYQGPFVNGQMHGNEGTLAMTDAAGVRQGTFAGTFENNRIQSGMYTYPTRDGITTTLQSLRWQNGTDGVAWPVGDAVLRRTGDGPRRVRHTTTAASPTAAMGKKETTCELLADC